MLIRTLLEDKDRTIRAVDFGSEPLVIEVHPLGPNVYVDACRWQGASPAITVKTVGSTFGRFMFRPPKVIVTNCEVNNA